MAQHFRVHAVVEDATPTKVVHHVYTDPRSGANTRILQGGWHLQEEATMPTIVRFSFTVTLDADDTPLLWSHVVDLLAGTSASSASFRLLLTNCIAGKAGGEAACTAVARMESMFWECTPLTTDAPFQCICMDGSNAVSGEHGTPLHWIVSVVGTAKIDVWTRTSPRAFTLHLNKQHTTVRPMRACGTGPTNKTDEDAMTSSTGENEQATHAQYFIPAHVAQQEGAAG